MENLTTLPARERVEGYVYARQQAADFVRSAGYPELAASILLNWAPGFLPPECPACGGSGDREVFVQSGGSMPWNAGDGHNELTRCPDCNGDGLDYAAPALSAPLAEAAPGYCWTHSKHPLLCGCGGPGEVVGGQQSLQADIDAKCREAYAEGRKDESEAWEERILPLLMVLEGDLLSEEQCAEVWGGDLLDWRMASRPAPHPFEQEGGIQE